MILTFAVAEQFVGASVRWKGQSAVRRGGPAGTVLIAALVVALSYIQVGAHWLIALDNEPRPDYVQVAARVDAEARRNGAAVRGPIAGNHWRQTLYIAYALDLPEYGASRTPDPGALADELLGFGIRLYLVFDDPGLAERLQQSGRFRHLADVTPRGAPGATVTVFEVPERGPRR